MTAYFFALFAGAVIVLLLTAWVSDRGIDLAVAWWARVRQQSIVIRFVWPFTGRWTVLRQQPPVVSEFDERRKLRAVMAIRGER